MDGNGRWAKHKGKPRFKGHQKGALVIEKISELLIQKNIPYLTLYAFSTENWNRPQEEIDNLMDLLRRYLKEKEGSYMKEQIRFDTIGDLERLPKDIQDKIHHLQQKTIAHKRLHTTLAINYGAKDELVRAVNKLQAKDMEMTQASIEAHLDTANLPPVDLLIRTGGHQRLSNFLLWQCAYAEINFTDTLWPDFSNNELEQMIDGFYTTKRKFGGL